MKKIEFVLTSQHSKRFLCDARWIANHQKKPIIIFSHGFKGFKDWGTFNLLADHFAQQGFVFLKFNYSHNGTTLDYPYEITDYPSFAENNFSKELDDLGTIIDWIHHESCPIQSIDLDKIYLVGHSRGGGSVILKSAEDVRVKKVVTWASVPAAKASLSEENIKEWKEKGVFHFLNGRNGEQLPINYQMVEDYYLHEERLSIEKNIQKSTSDILLIHGTEDETVPLKAMQLLHQWQKNSKMIEIEGATHTFGGKHPWEEESLPKHLEMVVKHTVQFLQD